MMKRTLYYLMPALLLAGAGCNKELLVPAGTGSQLNLVTSGINSITQTGAAGGLQLTGGFSQDVLNKGICWDKSVLPTVSDTKLSGGDGLGSVNLSLSGLTPGTTYYVRSYAVTRQETLYGNQVQFTTQPYQLASLSTSTVSGITLTTALGGGSISSAGGGAVSSRGVCWSTVSGPTVNNSRSIDGAGTGSFSSNLTGLSPGTLYYVRAYAVNQAGTAYGTQVSFTTVAVSLATVITTSVSAVTKNSAVISGSVTADGGGTVSSRGICWNTVSNPTLASGFSLGNGSGTGAISATMTGLASGTTYYARAYATNSAGTAYGVVISFRTL